MRPGSGSPIGGVGSGLRCGPHAAAHAGRVREAGMVTAEFAVALPAFVVVLVALALGASASVAQVRCVEAARTAARVVSLGEPAGAARDAALRVAEGARVVVSVEGPWALVRVEDSVARLGPAAVPFRVSAEARAWLEPGVASGGGVP